MRVKNVSARLKHVGGIQIVPGSEAEIPDIWRHAINKAELVEIVESGKTEQPEPVADIAEEPKKRGRPPKAKQDDDE